MVKENSKIYDIKFILVLLVILGHAIQYVYDLRQLDYDDNFIFKMIYIFHMPAFGFVSGYIQSKSNKNKIITYLKILIIPFFLWGIILNQNENLFITIKEIIIRSDKSLWFLLVIFECLLIDFLFINYNEKNKFLISSIVVYLLLVFIFVVGKLELLAIKQLLIIFPYFILGKYLSVFSRCDLNLNKKQTWACLLLCLVFCVILFQLWERSYLKFTPLIIHNEMINIFQFYIIRLISPLPFIILIYFYVINKSENKYWKKNKISKFFSNESLAFYALQFWVILFYTKYISNVNVNIAIDIISCFLFVTIITLLQIKILNKFEIVKKVLCGK